MLSVLKVVQLLSVDVLNELYPVAIKFLGALLS